MDNVDVILKRFETPDETREFTKGRLEVVRIGGLTIGRALLRGQGNNHGGSAWASHGATVRVRLRLTA